MNTCTTRVLTLALAVFALAALAVPAGVFARGGTTTTTTPAGATASARRMATVGTVNLFPDATAPGAKGRVLSNNQGTGSGIWPMSYEVDKLADGRYAAVVVTTAAIDPTQAPTRITLNGFFSVVNGKGGFSATLSTDFVPVAFEVYRLNDDFTQGPRVLSRAVAGGPYLG
jgi:hypothetical protein